MTIRDIIKEHDGLYLFDYKWFSKEFRPLDDVLEDYGYKLEDESILGEYNDIKGYLDCEIEEI